MISGKPQRSWRSRSTVAKPSSPTAGGWSSLAAASGGSRPERTSSSSACSSASVMVCHPDFSNSASLVLFYEVPGPHDRYRKNDRNSRRALAPHSGEYGDGAAGLPGEGTGMGAGTLLLAGLLWTAGEPLPTPTYMK